MKKIMLLGTTFLFLTASTCFAEPIKVVTTLSTFADLTKTIGGDAVDVSYIASPRFNPHFIEPKPSDVLKVKRADLFVHAGLDLELWRWPLVEAAGNREVMPGGSRELDLSRGVQLLEVPQGSVSRAEGDIHLYGNPHYWLDPSNARTMAESIYKKLSEIDPAHASEFQKNFEHFSGELDGKIREWKESIASIQGKELAGYHNSWPYLMHFAGLSMKAFLEPKPGIPPTPKQIEWVEQYMRQRKIPALVQESYFPKSSSEILSKRTGAKLVPLCQNVGELPGTSNYMEMLDYNIRELLTVFGRIS